MESNNVQWIIEKDVLDYTNKLVEYLNSYRIEYHLISYGDYLLADKYITNKATIFVGSLRCSKLISRYTSWFPGSICTLKNFDCTNYYSSWDPYLLNQDWSLTMKTLIEREINYLEDCKEISGNREFFFRPNEGDKRFTGGLSSRSQIVNKIRDNEIIIKADKKNIGREFRFLVVDKEVIDGCNYSNPSSTDKIFIAKEYLESILEDKNLFIPDRVFTVDIGENLDINKPGVIELNSFSCANLYSMNMDKVVPAINELAKDMYREENE